MAKPSGFGAVFRVDASIDIGAGHVMRCLTLAQAFRVKGFDCEFICREHDGNLISMIKQKGFDVIGLPVVQSSAMAEDLGSENNALYGSWLGADWETDARQTLDSIDREFVDLLVVDHYSLDERWETLVRGVCQTLLVIDDLANRPHCCDALLDQNAGRHYGHYSPLINPECRVLLGPKYALLRPEFSELRDYSLNRRANFQIRHILICMGGVDKQNYTEALLDALQECDTPEGIEITVVMGAHAPWLDRVRDKAALLPQQVTVKVGVENMAALIADSDLVIGAGGSSSWERCCLGVPSIVLATADNQRYIVQELEKAKAAKVANLSTLQSDVCEILTMLCDTPSSLAYMSRASAAITSGNGAGLVVASILGEGAL